MLLELRQVTAGYGIGPDILGGISLDLDEGRTYCLIGPNGAGKSTLLKTVAGLLRPRSGEVVFEGRPIGGTRPDLVIGSGICYVPQDRSLFPDMSVRENLVMGGFLERDRAVLRRRMGEVFDMFPVLGERAGQNAGTLSGGEQQMLALGRALMVEPKLMMIDEPSLGLAPQVADQIFATIARLGDRGITMLLVEQNVERGLECAEWAFLLDLGTVRFEGPSGDILDNPDIREVYLGRRPAARPERDGHEEEAARR